MTDMTRDEAVEVLREMHRNYWRADCVIALDLAIAALTASGQDNAPGEGVVEDARRYRLLCERHPLALQRMVTGMVEQGNIYRKDLIDAALDALAAAGGKQVAGD